DRPLPHVALSGGGRRGLQLLEGVVDELEPAGPVPVDRALGHAGPSGDRFDGGAGVSAFGEEGDGGVEDDAPRALDPRVAQLQPLARPGQLGTRVTGISLARGWPPYPPRRRRARGGCRWQPPAPSPG